jgi:hypothetical protein
VHVSVSATRTGKSTNAINFARWKQSHEAEATTLMSQVTPVYALGRPSGEGIVEEISALLDRPVSITSRGPTHLDKQFSPEIFGT